MPRSRGDTGSDQKRPDPQLRRHQPDQTPGQLLFQGLAGEVLFLWRVLRHYPAGMTDRPGAIPAALGDRQGIARATKVACRPATTAASRSPIWLRMPGRVARRRGGVALAGSWRTPAATVGTSGSTSRPARSVCGAGWTEASPRRPVVRQLRTFRTPAGTWGFPHVLPPPTLRGGRGARCRGSPAW